MDTQKRKKFLYLLEKKYKKHEEFSKLAGPGIKKKFLRFFLFPDIYITYLIIRFLKRKNIKSKLFWGQEIVIKTFFKGSPLFLAFSGILPGKGEYKLTKFLIKNLKPNDIFYDIGANYGFYTYLALEFCKEVHSFEPLPDVFESLKANLEKKANVFLNQVALSDKIGLAKIYIPESSSLDASGSSTIVEENLNQHYYKFSASIEIKTITLDEYLKKHNKPTFIKMDVEGAESLVIKGGINFFKNYSPLISMEVWSSKEGEKISMKAVELLRSLGYNSFFINEEGDLEFVDGDLSRIVDQENLFDDNFIFKKG